RIRPELESHGSLGHYQVGRIQDAAVRRYRGRSFRPHPRGARKIPHGSRPLLTGFLTLSHLQIVYFQLFMVWTSACYILSVTVFYYLGPDPIPAREHTGGWRKHEASNGRE